MYAVRVSRVKRIATFEFDSSDGEASLSISARLDNACFLNDPCGLARRQDFLAQLFADRDQTLCNGI